MSTMTITTKITHRYLMNKTKWDLASFCMDVLRRFDLSSDEVARVIDQEIDWCNKNPGIVTDEQRQWFIRGLEQAKFLTNKLTKASEEE